MSNEVSNKIIEMKLLLFWNIFIGKINIFASQSPRVLIECQNS